MRITDRCISSLLLLFVLTAPCFGQSEVHRSESPVTNSETYRIAHANGYTMLTGVFSRIGPYTGCAAVLDMTTGAQQEGFPQVSGSIDEVVPDGSGGWYIGGSFSAINNIPIYNLAHIRADNTLDETFKPNPESSVLAMALSGNTLYVGGYFQVMAGATRNFLAAFDTSTGALNNWNPNCNSWVNTLDVNGSIAYFGGNFTSVGGVTRNRVAAVNATTGALTAWNPGVTSTSSTVTTIKATASTVYVGGTFKTIGGQSRNGLAAVTSAGAVLAFDPNPVVGASGSVYTMELSGNTLYIGGYFTTVSGLARKQLAAVNATTGAVLAWNPIFDDFDAVYKIALSGNTIYAAGYFDSVNGVQRSGFAAINATNASLLSLNLRPERGSIGTVTTAGTSVFVGGSFNGLNWNARPGLAFINANTDEILPFTVDLAGGYAWSMDVKGDIAYIGGQFSSVNKVARKNLCAIDLTTGQVLPWAPIANGTTAAFDNTAVYAVEIRNDLLYVGGIFLNVNATSRAGLAAIDLNTGALNNWNPVVGTGTNSSQFIYSLDLVGNTVYVGGQFATIGGQQRTDLAAIDATSGAILPWAPTCDGYVSRIRVGSNAAYVIGDFGKFIGGASRPRYAAAVDLTSGNATSWNPDLRNGYAADLALSQTEVYVGGTYDSVGLKPKNGLASFSLATGSLTSWNPDMGLPIEGGPGVYAVETSSTRLFLGGYFEYLGNEDRTHYAEYDICPSPPTITLTGNTLTSTAADSYQWFKDDLQIENATSQNIPIRLYENGTYYVQVVNQGCISRSNDFSYLITATESASDNTVIVYPNPVSRNITIKIEKENPPYQVQLISMMGSVVKNYSGNDNLLQLETSDLTAGAYLVLITAGGHRYVRKIIKQ